MDPVRGATIYFKIFELKANDIQKNTFRTRCDHYEYLIMPFGVINAPTFFSDCFH